MSTASSGRAEEPGGVPSRRSLLRGGTFLGLSVMAGAGLAAAGQRPAVAATQGRVYARAADLEPAGNMILDYQPGQPTGWPKAMGETVGGTVGGHVPSADFTYNGTAYTVSLVPFGQPGDSPDPVYEPVPADPGTRFRETLAGAWSDYYAFRYVGDSPGWGKLSVQSYAAFAVQSAQPPSPPLVYGADVYVVHTAGGRLAGPAARGNLRWIQVVNNAQAIFADNSGRANPFYSSGGLTSVYGRQVVNFYDRPQASTFPGATGSLPSLFMAEVFLAEDTGTTDRSGKGIVNVFGGLKYGWQVQKK